MAKLGEAHKEQVTKYPAWISFSAAISSDMFVPYVHGGFSWDYAGSLSGCVDLRGFTFPQTNPKAQKGPCKDHCPLRYKKCYMG